MTDNEFSLAISQLLDMKLKAELHPIKFDLQEGKECAAHIEQHVTSSKQC